MNTETEKNPAVAPSALTDVLCAGTVKVQRLCGGGTSWFYALCSCGHMLGASHQDDRAGMAKLLSIKAHN